MTRKCHNHRPQTNPPPRKNRMYRTTKQWTNTETPQILGATINNQPTTTTEPSLKKINWENSNIKMCIYFAINFMYLIVSIPDLCLHTYFNLHCLHSQIIMFVFYKFKNAYFSHLINAIIIPKFGYLPLIYILLLFSLLLFSGCHHRLSPVLYKCRGLLIFYLQIYNVLISPGGRVLW